MITYFLGTGHCSQAHCRDVTQKSAVGTFRLFVFQLSENLLNADFLLSSRVKWFLPLCHLHFQIIKTFWLFMHLKPSDITKRFFFFFPSYDTWIHVVSNPALSISLMGMRANPHDIFLYGSAIFFWYPLPKPVPLLRAPPVAPSTGHCFLSLLCGHCKVLAGSKIIVLLSSVNDFIEFELSGE